MPERIQRKRTKGYKMPENTVSVTRPGKWGNPFKVGMVIRDPQNDEYITTLKTVDDVLNWYRKWLRNTGKTEDVKELQGKNLACFCPLDQPCHADVLLEIANN
jgi:hypothetical protein